MKVKAANIAIEEKECEQVFKIFRFGFRPVFH